MADDHNGDAENNEEIQEAVERAASRVLADKLGLELGPDGKVKAQDVDADVLKEQAGPVAAGMIAAVAAEMKERGKWPEPGKGPKQPVIGPDGEPMPQLNQAIQDIGATILQKMSEKLHENVGIPLGSDGVLDTSALQNDDVQRDLAEKLQSFFSAVGDTVENVRDKMVALPKLEQIAEPEAVSGEEPADLSTATAESEDPEVKVLDFDEWKQRIEDKRSSAFSLGDTFQESIGRFVEKQLTQVGPDGKINLNLDQEWFQKNGPALIQQAVQQFSKAFVPPKIEVSLPATQVQADAPEEDSEPQENAESDSGVKLSVNLDLASIFGKFFKAANPTLETKE